MIFFDSHVHIQEIFALDALLKSAERNFSRQLQEISPDLSGTFYLLLTEAKKLSFFSKLKHQLEKGQALLPGGWRISATQEQESILLIHDDSPGNRLFLVAGRQIVTKERLEVLALATAAIVADNQSLEQTVDEVRNHQGLAVLPWGAGKWLGTRGKIVSDFLDTANPTRLFVGDNGGRPVFWPTPQPFITAEGRGIRLLPGSDPLPLPGEELRTGSYGAYVQGKASNESPAADLKALLIDKAMHIQPFGRRQGAFLFFKNQLALRLK